MLSLGIRGHKGKCAINNDKNTPFKSAYDAVVIGGGHNGLVAAAYLAKAGLSVLVLERRPSLGGAAATEEIFPGFRVNTGAGDAGIFLPQIVADLNLENHDLEFIESPVVALALHPDDHPLVLWRERNMAAEAISSFSQADAEKYPAFLAKVDQYTKSLNVFRTLPPPSLPKYRYGELLPWLRVGLDLKRSGDQELTEFMRILPMSVADFLDEWFETPLLKSTLGISGVMGSMQGPRSAGTTFMFLYHALGAGEAGFRASRMVRGGTGMLSRALASAAQMHGAEICTQVTVREITLEGDRATGVLLQSGKQVSAQVIVSSTDPCHTFFDLLRPKHHEVRFLREIRNIKFRGSTARINLALRGLPEFACLKQIRASAEFADFLSGHILICPDLEMLERAYDEAKYGHFSQNPCLDIIMPSILDPSLVPSGQHLMSIDVRYAPYDVHGTWEMQRAAMGDRVVEVLEAYAPGIRQAILHRQVLTPLDYEREYRLPEGAIYHGQMGLDQLLFMRPVPGYSRYRTPIENLYLCGAGNHPGGGVTGAPGYHATRQILSSSLFK